MTRTVDLVAEPGDRVEFLDFDDDENDEWIAGVVKARRVVYDIVTQFGECLEVEEQDIRKLQQP